MYSVYVMSLISHAGEFPVPAVAGVVAALIVVAIVAVLIIVIVQRKRARDTKSGSYNSVERPDKVSRKGKVACK